MSSKPTAPIDSRVSSATGLASTETAKPPMSGTIVSGCLWSLVSAVITAIMLFVNGSFVLALVTVLVKTDVPYIGNDGLTQALLFTIPVVMVIIEWLMLDYVRSRLSFGSPPSRDESV